MSVLGLAYLRGPCTTYAIMKELSTSGSSYYKSRAGTAYSVAKRLAQFGLIEVIADQVQITEKGLNQLRDWIAPPIPMIDVAHTVDLIRLRFFFLQAVDPATRLHFIDVSIQSLEKLLAECQALIGENQELNDYFGALASVAIIMETRSRIEWLKWVREWVKNPLAPEENWTEAILKSI